MLRSLMAGAAAGAALLAFQASAQAPKPAGDEATMYSKGHFKGARRTVFGPTRFEQPFVMKSAKSCRIAVGILHRNTKPGAASHPVGPGHGHERALGASSRESCRRPRRCPDWRCRGGRTVAARPGQRVFRRAGPRRQPVEVTPGTAEAMSRRAIEFWRAHGWRGSAHERLQTVGGRFYPDVLCADDGG